MASLVRAPVFPNSPEPRSGFCMVLHQDKIYFWGGYTQELMEDYDKSEFYPVDETLPNTDDNFMDVYDILDNSWHRYRTTNNVPDFGTGSTIVGYGEHLFLYGGWNEGDFNGEIFKLDINSFEWKQLDVGDENKPTARYLTTAVVFESKMCVFGGTCPSKVTDKIQRGADYIELRQFDHSYGFGWNNEMFFFDLEKYIWSSPELGKSRPPPCAGFTFNMIDSHRALLFGGKQKELRVADIYIFDFHKMKWNDVITQRSCDEPWPAGRTFHSTTCLIDPSTIEEYQARHGPVDQQLLVLWGKGTDNKHCRDNWIYNIRTNRWKKFETDLRHRMWHKACAYFPSVTTSNTILFGGNRQRKSNQEKHVMSDLTIYSFGVLELKVICMEGIRRYELEGLLEKEASYVIKNLYREYCHAQFHYLS